MTDSLHRLLTDVEESQTQDNTFSTSTTTTDNEHRSIMKTAKSVAMGARTQNLGIIWVTQESHEEMLRLMEKAHNDRTNQLQEMTALWSRQDEMMRETVAHFWEELRER